MFDMSTAPRDGTRILIKCQMFGYVRELGRYTPCGTKWQECRFLDGKWSEWCGNSRTQSTSSIDPFGWAPLPSSEIEPC